MLANMIGRNVMPSYQYLNLFRRIASFAAIGFLLLIPLQTYGRVAGIRRQLQQGQTQLSSLGSAANMVRKASNETQLRDALRAVPGAEELASRPLGADVQTIKKALLDRLHESTNRLKFQLDDAQNKALLNTVTPIIRDAVISIGYAIGFAGMGYSKTGKPTPLRRILKAKNSQIHNDNANEDLNVIEARKPVRN